MRRVYQVAALVFLAFSAFVMAQARELTYWVKLGPGPGFFPFWLGAILGLLTLAWASQVTVKPVDSMPEDFIPNHSGVMRILAILAALILFVGFVDILGFRATMLAFLLFLLLALGRQNLLLTAVISLAGSFGLFYVFRELLGVYLPVASIEFLQNLGL